jgi:sterol desaturase/sphingolipid hydroxylase (fatty acid hydroxylase superfamily)
VGEIDLNFKIISAAVLAVLFGVLFSLGILKPLRRRSRPFGRRLLVNGLLTILSFGAGMLAVAPVSVYILSKTTGTKIGLLHLASLPFWAEFLIGVLLLDLSFYYWHRMNHEIPLLWRFHNVHHVDPDVDVTTSFRFHVVEIAYSSVFRAVQVLIIGPVFLTYVIYEIIFQASTMFHHSNVRLPLGLERIINKVFVTPRMHGIHHSAMKEETNSNYSVVFRWWDWLNRTLHLNVKQAEITIGVPAYLEKKDNRFWDLMVMPFVGQRDYWKTKDGSKRETREAEESRLNQLEE